MSKPSAKAQSITSLQQNTNFYSISSVGLSHATIAISGNGQTLLTLVPSLDIKHIKYYGKKLQSW